MRADARYEMSSGKLVSVRLNYSIADMYSQNY